MASGAIERFDDEARQKFESMGHTTVYRGELLRHPVYTRVIHWSVALFFFLALFTGFGIYLPWLFRWFTPIFGGGPLSRILHPYFGVGFVFFFSLQVLNWLKPMLWAPGDTRWMRNVHKIVSNEEKMDPPETGFFNAGQKANVLGDRRAAASSISLPAPSCGLERELLAALRSLSATFCTTYRRSSCSAESLSTSTRARSANREHSRP